MSHNQGPDGKKGRFNRGQHGEMELLTPVSLPNPLTHYEKPSQDNELYLVEGVSNIQCSCRSLKLSAFLMPFHCSPNKRQASFTYEGSMTRFPPPSLILSHTFFPPSEHSSHTSLPSLLGTGQVPSHIKAFAVGCSQCS